MINAIGLQNPGSNVVINDIMPRLDKTETRFIINISTLCAISDVSLIRREFGNDWFRCVLATNLNHTIGHIRVVTKCHAPFFDIHAGLLLATIKVAYQVLRLNPLRYSKYIKFIR
jgi:hypothetical protein